MDSLILFLSFGFLFALSLLGVIITGWGMQELWKKSLPASVALIVGPLMISGFGFSSWYVLEMI